MDKLSPEMADDKLKPAVETLLAKYPAETVALYLNAFNGMSEANWPNLKAMLKPTPPATRRGVKGRDVW